MFHVSSCFLRTVLVTCAVLLGRGSGYAPIPSDDGPTKPAPSVAESRARPSESVGILESQRPGQEPGRDPTRLRMGLECGLPAASTYVLSASVGMCVGKRLHIHEDRRYCIGN